MIAIDIEASGTNPNTHSIISIGAVDLNDKDKRFYGECRIWDGAHISEEATAIHGQTDEEITDTKKQTEGELVEKFMRWIDSCEDRTLVGQNVSFDRDFIKHACARIHLECSLAHRIIDTHSLCYMHIIKRGLVPPFDEIKRHSALNLDAVLQYCGIPEEPKPHNALTGAISHAEVAHRLLYDKKFLPEFDKFEMPWK